METSLDYDDEYDIQKKKKSREVRNTKEKKLLQKESIIKSNKIHNLKEIIEKISVGETTIENETTELRSLINELDEDTIKNLFAKIGYQNYKLPIIQFLIDMGADPLTTNNFLLIHSCDNNNIKEVIFLLENYDIDLNGIKNNFYFTSINIRVLLIEFGYKITDNYVKVSLSYSIICEHKYGPNYEMELIKLFLDNDVELSKIVRIFFENCLVAPRNFNKIFRVLKFFGEHNVSLNDIPFDEMMK